MVLYMSMGPVDREYLVTRQILNNSYLTYYQRMEDMNELADPIHVQFVKEPWTEDIWQLYAESQMPPDVLLPMLRGISKATGCTGEWYKVIDEVAMGGVDSE